MISETDGGEVISCKDVGDASGMGDDNWAEGGLS